jgi:hypothetical protein
MKITVIETSNGKIETMAACPWILDDSAVTTRRRAPDRGWRRFRF